MKTKLARKKNGIHYTPKRLAHFLADQIWDQVSPQKSQQDRRTLRILDPACGDGRLLRAMIDRAPSGLSVEITGFETDEKAAEQARDSLSKLVPTTIIHEDFLDHTIEYPNAQFDVVITNPPYVRTQHLGADQTDKLRRAFKLTGRLDLYQAFTIASTSKLEYGGTMGLLTSNRFMYVQSGQAMRRFLLENYQLKQIFDFGDTKLFQASVLPMVLIGNRKELSREFDAECPMVRVYQSSDCDTESSMDIRTDATTDLFEAVAGSGEHSCFEQGKQRLKIESGELHVDWNVGNHWTLQNRTTLRFQNRIHKHRRYKFGDIAEIKVGIKTTADAVFVRSDWQDLPTEIVPESELLRPLISHHVCRRWRLDAIRKKVLYPYHNQSPRQTVDLNNYPHTQRYLLSHEDRLRGRSYLSKSNRQWYEIWVPQVPTDWEQPKIVWPDISEKPNFAFDVSGAIVNGDCYWIKLKQGFECDWMYLMLAVANSSLAIEYYDTYFHNKLYSGRRRYMTQYVKQFPLPDIDREICQRVVEVVKRNLRQSWSSDYLEQETEELVSEIFGR